MPEVIWQKAASPTCHPSRLQIDPSNLDRHLIYGSLDPHKSAPPPNGISIGSAVFAQYISVINTQTDRPRYVRHLLQ